MKIATTLIKPPDSESFFRIYAETPGRGCRTFCLDFQTHQMIWSLLCKLSVPSRSSIRKGQDQVPDENAERVKKIIRYMEANLDRKINLNRVASHIGMNSKSLSWFCSHHLPGGFSAFLIAMRLDRAADLLLSTSDTVLYISLSCGFESISNFNKQFRKKFGMSPSNFRRK